MFDSPANRSAGSRWVAAGALCCAGSVMAGAFGAHALAARLDPRALQLWETAARYFFFGGIGQLAAGLLARGGAGGRAAELAGACLLSGGLLFSGTVGALALGGPRWLGAVTPLGGLLLIAGFLLLAWASRGR
jgi:uncharacterized membrane protein YgdD (TMEM256/DUF423 family)